MYVNTSSWDLERQRKQIHNERAPKYNNEMDGRRTRRGWRKKGWVHEMPRWPMRSFRRIGHGKTSETIRSSSTPSMVERMYHDERHFPAQSIQIWKQNNMPLEAFIVNQEIEGGTIHHHATANTWYPPLGYPIGPSRSLKNVRQTRRVRENSVKFLIHIAYHDLNFWTWEGRMQVQAVRYLMVLELRLEECVSLRPPCLLPARMMCVGKSCSYTKSGTYPFLTENRHLLPHAKCGWQHCTDHGMVVCIRVLFEGCC